MQNLIILFSLSMIQTLSVTFLTASTIIILARVQNYNSSIKAVSNVFFASVLVLAISTGLILYLDFEQISQWMIALSIVDVAAFLSGLSIGVQNVKNFKRQGDSKWTVKLLH